MIKLSQKSPVSSCTAFSQHSVARFSQVLEAFLTRDLGLRPTEARAFGEWAGDALVTRREAAFELLRVRLISQGIRDRWNHLLRVARPRVLEQWCRPFVQSPVLDLLCGDGRVGDQLQNQGFQVTLAERDQDYRHMPKLYGAPFIRFDGSPSQWRERRFKTVLLLTVLHHENDWERLLNLAFSLAGSRLIVVENCLETDDETDFHQLLDLFFNQCLNSIQIECPARHGFLRQWVGRLERLGGRVVETQRRDFLPGVPISHHLLVVDVLGDS